jgi:thiol:disulfide interchange protein DsbD
MGLVSGLIASPCTGPVLAFILTLISQSGDLANGSMLMVAFGFGMGLPFLVLGTFSSALARMPKSGAWMNRVKYFLSGIMILASLYFLYLGVNGLLKKNEPVAVVHSELAWIQIGNQPDAQQKLAQALADAKSKGRPVMIDFFADWCVACKELEKLTFADSKVAAVFKGFDLIRVDLTTENDALREVQKNYGIVGLPLLVFYNAKGEMLKDLKIFGYMDARQFLEHLSKVK